MIDINLSDLMPHELLGLLSLQSLEATLDTLAASARVKWVRLAQTELKSSRQAYVNGIGEIETIPGMRVIALSGWLANAVEKGIDAWDLRETVLFGRASHVGQDGSLYVHVPFRHGTPGTTGLVGAEIGSAYGPHGASSRAAGGLLTGGQAEEFGKELYQSAKRLRTRTKRKGPGSMSERSVAGAYRAAGGRGSPLLQPHHQSSIYSGMRRERKPYVSKTGKTTTQSQYVTWRTISEGKGDGWWHPGIEARNLSERVSDHVGSILPSIMKKAVAAAVGG